jgi:hypothetical protein
MANLDKSGWEGEKGQRKGEMWSAEKRDGAGGWEGVE